MTCSVTKVYTALFGVALCMVHVSATQAVAQQVKATKSEINAFIKADKNEDRQINKSEFRVLVNLMAASGQPTAKRIKFFRAYSYAFSVADKDKNGILSPKELRSADNDYKSGKR